MPKFEISIEKMTVKGEGNINPSGAMAWLVNAFNMWSPEKLTPLHGEPLVGIRKLSAPAKKPAAKPAKGK